MKTILLSIALVIPALADAGGNWKVEGDVMGNPVNAVCSMKVSDNKLSGTCKTNHGDSDLTGMVDGQSVSWEIDMEAEGQTYRVAFVGKLDSEDAMSGVIQVAGVEGAFSAKKN